MTRINCVPPAELCRQHLVAEYRELPRVFGLVRAAQARGLTPETLRAPSCYTLGAGHVLFFYSRLSWLARRQSQLVLEMVARGYDPQFRGDLVKLNCDLRDSWWGSWEPTPEALALCRARIADRLPQEYRT